MYVTIKFQQGRADLASRSLEESVLTFPMCI